MNRYTLISILYLITGPCWSNPILTGNENRYWQCTAYDQEQRQWIAKSPYKRSAINKAYASCKKQSAHPRSCKTAKESCEPFINGLSLKPMWRCTALDLKGKAWMSDIYNQRDDAAIGAKAYCQDRSSIPESCYINLLTCKDLNPLSEK